MEEETLGEFFVLDRNFWEEVTGKKVQRSGFVYLGRKTIGRDIRIFIDKKNGE